MSIFDEYGKLKRLAWEDNYKGLTLKEMAEQLGIHASKLSNVEAGGSGLSTTVAKKAAELYEESPATVFLTTQVRSLKYRIGRGDLDPAGVLQSAGATIKSLQGFDATERDEDDPEFAAAVEELTSIAEKALTLDLADGGGIGKAATKNSRNSLDALGRDTFGRRTQKHFGTSAGERTSQTTATKAGQDTLTRLGRDGSGRKIKKRYGG